MARKGIRTVDRRMKANAEFDFKYVDNPKAPHRNLIGHGFDWDGTLRSYKAEYIINKFDPTNAYDIVDILESEVNPLWNDIYDQQFPMFYNNDEFVNYVDERAGKDNKFRNYYITNIDRTDIVADMWKLSPKLQQIYPSKPREDPNNWVFGTYIGAGWHDLLKEVEKEMRNRKISIRTYRHELLEL